MRIFSTLAALLLITVTSTGQTTLFQADFIESGAFVLNTTDVGSVANGANTWVVNAVYTGGDGTVDCSGFELPFSIPATPGQPAGISGPGGPYLHIASTEALNDGVACCSFAAADGFCTEAGSHFAGMTADVSTLGLSDVNLSFWWLCNGGNSIYGEVYYSVNEGLEWNLITAPVQQFRNVSVWTEHTVSLPAFADQGTLRFGFRFVNQTSLLGGADPGFAIDDVLITGNGQAELGIGAPTVSTSEYCLGTDTDIPFTASGVFQPGNIFVAEISDASGSFAAPVSLGFLEATSAGTIPCTWPAFLPPGAGYRIRVVSDSPLVEGPPNGTDIALFGTPFPGNNAEITACAGGPVLFLFEALGGSPVTCGSWLDPFAQPFDGTFEVEVDAEGSYTYITDCPGPCPAQEAQVFVTWGSSAGADVEAALCANGDVVQLSDYLNGAAQNGTFYLNGEEVDGNALILPGVYEVAYVVEGSAGCANDTALLVFDVVQPPAAGASVSYTTCITTPPFALVSLLIGAAEDGFWTDPAGEDHDGVLDPVTDVSGLYTYTVAGQAPCTDDQAFVALVIDPCAGLAEHAVNRHRLQWLGQSGAMHMFTFNGSAIPEAATLIGADGRAVRMTARYVNERLMVPANGLASGPYTLLVRTGADLHRGRLIHVAE